jgi:hypothetical protein
MKLNQIHVFTAAVSGDLQKIIHALESRFAGQIGGDVRERNLSYRIYDYVAFVHPILTTYLYMWARPDANAARNSAVPDSIAKAFCEHHFEPHQNGHSPGARTVPNRDQ